MGRPGCPPEFRRKVLDLLAAGRSVAHDLGISDQTIYNWRHQGRIDHGEQPGLTSVEKAELTVARRAVELLRDEASPKGGIPRST